MDASAYQTIISMIAAGLGIGRTQAWHMANCSSITTAMP